MIHNRAARSVLWSDKIAIFLVPYTSFVFPFSDSFTLSFFFLFLSAVVGLVIAKNYFLSSDFFFSFASIFLFLIVFIYSGSDSYAYVFSRFLSLSLFILNVLFLMLSVRRAILYKDESVLSAFYYGLFSAVLIGIMDFILFSFFGVPYFPINFFDHYFGGVQAIYGFLQFGSDLVYRPGGLSGEPKTYGMFSVTLLILTSLFYRYNLNRSCLFLAFVAACVGIVLSGSTSALILALLFVIFYFSTVLLVNKKLVIAVSFCVFLIPSFFYYYLVLSGNVLLSQYDHELALDSRGILGFMNSRLFSRFGMEDFDYFSILSVTRDNLLLLIGNGGFLGNLFLSDSDYVGWWLSSDVNFSAKSGFVFVHSLMGIFAFPLIIIPILHYLSNRLLRMQVVSYGTLLLCVLIPLLFILRSYMLFSCIVLWCTVVILDSRSKNAVAH